MDVKDRFDCIFKGVPIPRRGDRCAKRARNPRTRVPSCSIVPAACPTTRPQSVPSARWIGMASTANWVRLLWMARVPDGWIDGLVNRWIGGLRINE